MWQGLGTSHNHDMKKIREQLRPLVPTPEIQARLTPFLPHSVAHHHTDKGESEVVPSFHIHVWVFSSPPTLSRELLVSALPSPSASTKAQDASFRLQHTHSPHPALGTPLSLPQSAASAWAPSPSPWQPTIL